MCCTLTDLCGILRNNLVWKTFSAVALPYISTLFVCSLGVTLLEFSSLLGFLVFVYICFCFKSVKVSK